MEVRIVDGEKFPAHAVFPFRARVLLEPLRFLE